MKKLFFLLVLTSLLFILNCENSQNDNYDIILSKWMYLKAGQDDVFYSLDTTYNGTFIFFEDKIKIEKQTFDSLLYHCTTNEKHALGGFIIIIDTSFYRLFEGQKIHCVKVYASNNSYAVAIIYNEQFGILAKQYGHGKAINIENKYIKNDKLINVYDFSRFSEALLDDESLFPKPPWPPLPPPNKLKDPSK